MAIGICLIAAGAEAAGCDDPIARFTSAQGDVQYRHADEDAWIDAALDTGLCAASSVRVGREGRAALQFVNDSTLRLKQGTSLRLQRQEPERSRTFLEMLSGAIHFLSHRPRSLAVETPFVNAGTEGTEFLIEVEADQARVVTYEGRVALANDEGDLVLGSGEAAITREGGAPTAVIAVRPRNAVAWALHYPSLGREADETGRLLRLGRAGAAEALIAERLERRPDSAETLAERSVLRMVQGQLDEAMRDADRAVDLAPASASALIAQSYVRQAAFDLDGSRRSLEQAIEAEPENALAHARLSEILLSIGDRDGAVEAAGRAEELAPDLARAQTVLGFAALAAIDVETASRAFDRAIALDSADPLPRLGRGLALIRDGDLEAGRGEIEIAAGLDPNHSLLRSYLGKAYFEERRDPRAGDQYDIAKTLDPNDPTPWFYDAIRKQLDNRPVEALKDLEAAIAKNDNRAVYRSRLLLDQDRGSRGASLARIYDDLGFEQLALNRATRSLADDPGNHSAHRFLSDAYAGQPRHEVARASELLQSQLLQPLNINPAPPSQAFTDLNVTAGGGPAEAGFNEFHPLFERDRLQATGSVFVGDHDTFGDEIVVSGLVDRFAVSAGQFHSETDGYRDNNDVENDLYDLFFQAAVTPKLNLQAEYRRRETEQGDLFSNFDLDDFSPDDRTDVEQDIFRLGGHFQPGVGRDLLLSLIYADKTQESATVFGPFSSDFETEDAGFQAEAQFQVTSDEVSLVTGASYYAVDFEQRTKADVGIGTPAVSEREFDREQTKVYGYATLSPLPRLDLTLGGALSNLKDDTFERNDFAPKAGLRYEMTDWLTFRAAAFWTVKSTLAVQQTIEPTQLAGFNQLLDDLNGTEARNYAVGLDARPSEDWSVGGAFWHRDVEEPFIIDRGAGFETEFRGGKEDLYQLYAYWTPHPRWSLTAEARYEEIERNLLDFDAAPPLEVDSFSLPLFARYFAPNGIFVEAGATYRHQDVERSALSTGASGEDAIVLVDATLGYRLPKRRGVASLEVRNLFDREFDNQDLNFITSETRAFELYPERSVMARLTLNF